MAGIAYDICSIWMGGKDRVLNFPLRKEMYLSILSNTKTESLKELRILIKKYIQMEV
jgi:hypothetical protein